MIVRTGFEQAVELAILAQGEVGRRMVVLRDRIEAEEGRRLVFDPVENGTLEDEEPTEEEDDDDGEPPKVTPQDMQRFYAGFLDHPIPGLLGMTVRQASRDPWLHGVIEEVLASHETMTVKHYGADVADFDQMRRALGLVV